MPHSLSKRPGTQNTQSADNTTGGPEEVVNAYIIDEPKGPSSSRLGGALTMAAGGAIALVGIPMLILPGPGLLAIGGGIYLISRGAKTFFGKK